MTLNESKCEFTVNHIRCLGCVISSTGVCVNPETVQGLNDSTMPACVGDVRRFLGMVNQLGKFSDQLNESSQPLPDLLCNDTGWYWGLAQEKIVLPYQTTAC